MTASLGPRVLVVEDHPDTADLLGRYARPLNCETRVCHTGKDALATALEFLPQIVLLDILLPDMDGWELARALKAELEPVNPVMISVTACASPEHRMKSRQVGINHHLNKPEFREDLMRLLIEKIGIRDEVGGRRRASCVRRLTLADCRRQRATRPRRSRRGVLSFSRIPSPNR